MSGGRSDRVLRGRRVLRSGLRWGGTGQPRLRDCGLGCTAGRAESILWRVRRTATRARCIACRRSSLARRELEARRCGPGRGCASLGLRRTRVRRVEPVTAIPAEDEICRVFRAAPITPHVTRGPCWQERVKGTFRVGRFLRHGAPTECFTMDQITIGGAGRVLRRPARRRRCVRIRTRTARPPEAVVRCPPTF